MRIYKLLSAEEWRAAKERPRWQGSADDLRDGFIHFSTAAQLEETARRHFAGRTGLIVLEVEAESLGSALRWEESRGGAAFPHLYAPLEIAKVVSAQRFGDPAP